MKKTLLTLASLCLVTTISAQNNVTVNFNKVVKADVRQGASSANLCWLLDSDKNKPNATKSMEQAIVEVGAGSLRFPYGHLADNYYWHTAPYDDVENGLRPATAVMTRPPSKWKWAVNADGSFINDMDFDEFMALCQKRNIEPLVVVNLLSFKYVNGPSIEKLAESAAEWVKYAKKRNYKVAYWQLGNEIDHHPKLITIDEFVEAYKVIAAAMKKVDPDANIGPGILGKQHYFTTLYKAAPELVDFTSCHQYMFPFIKTCTNYDMWSKSNEMYIPNVMKMQRAVNNVGANDMEILITETGVSPAGRGLGDVSNTYKALWWFEVLMSELMVPNVSYAFFWGTHSPWKGEVDDQTNDVAVMFRVDDNSRKPTGEVSMLVNSNLKQQFVESNTTSLGLRVFSMASKDKKQGTIFIMNKQKSAVQVNVNLSGMPKNVNQFQQVILSGKTPYDRKMTLSEGKPVDVKGNNAAITAQPLSITVLRYQ